MNDTDIEICYLSASDTLKKYKEKKLSPSRFCKSKSTEKIFEL